MAQNESPLKSHPNTNACQSMIHDSPAQAQLTSCDSSEVHCAD
jgi:hypothetical protein